VYGGDPSLPLIRPLRQKNLRIYQMKGGNIIPHSLPHPFPVRPVLGKLITGDNRPGGKIGWVPGKEQPRNGKPQIKEPRVYIIHELTISQRPEEMLQ
jgi:hypothetical protein